MLPKIKSVTNLTKDIDIDISREEDNKSKFLSTVKTNSALITLDRTSKFDRSNMNLTLSKRSDYKYKDPMTARN